VTFEVTSPDATSDNAPFTYERQLGLQESPFALTANPRFLFESRSYGVAIAQIYESLRRHEPIIVITGEAGTGKTMVGRVLTAQKNADLLVAAIATPPDTPDDLLRLLLDEFGVMPRDSRRASEISRFELLRTLEQFLVSLAAVHATAVVVVDEAHRLKDETLEQLRSLSNLETENRKLLQIVLLAEPEFEARLESTALTPLRQRITRLHALRPLTPKEVTPYIEKRLSVARGSEPLLTWPFTGDGIEAINALSRGVPRVINILCDRALEIGCAWNVPRADRRVVLAAGKHLHLDIPLRLTIRSQARPLAAAAVIIAALGIAGWFALNRASRSEPADVASQRSQPATQAAPITPPAAVVSSTSTAAANPNVRPSAAPVSASAAAPSAVPATSASPSGPPPAGAAPATVTDGFAVLAASFRTRERADQIAQDLARNRLPVRIRTTTAGWYQVVLGPYQSREEAKAARDGLGTTAFADATIVPASTDLGATPRAVPTAGPSSAPSPAASPAAKATVVPASLPSGDVAPRSTAAPAAPPAVAAASSAAPVARGASAPVGTPGTLQAAVRRAEALAQVPDVRGLIQLRTSIASSPEATANPSAEITSALSRIDALLDAARQKQLELDARQLQQSRERGNPR
jgi:type II secretory pathway predicted ATPase ExeA